MSIEFNASAATVVPSVDAQTYNKWTLKRFSLIEHDGGTGVRAVVVKSGVTGEIAEQEIILCQDIFDLGQDVAAQALVDKLTIVTGYLGKQQGIFVD